MIAPVCAWEHSNVACAYDDAMGCVISFKSRLHARGSIQMLLVRIMMLWMHATVAKGRLPGSDSGKQRQQ